MKAPRRIVLLGHDSIDPPIRGGEQRSHWIHRIYLDHAEAWNIEVAYRYDPRFLAAFRPQRRGLRAAFSSLEARVRGASVALTRQLGHRPKTAAALRVRLEEARKLVAEAAIVHFEHPFAYPFFERSLAGKRIIYSSHNIESRILFDYFRSDGVFSQGGSFSGDRVAGSVRAAPGESRRLLDRIARIESALVRRADLVLACAERDARHYRRIGARDVCVAANGAVPILAGGAPPQVDPPFARHALFVSSDWKPNAAALLRFCGDLDLPVGRGLVCAGTIADSTLPGFERLRANPSVAFVGPVDAPRLAALVAGARTLIVPACGSGGSNIKTAEALLTRKPMVVTSAALRGFESFSDSPGVRIRDTPSDFRRQIAADLEASQRMFPRPGVRALEWPNALAPAREAIERVIGWAGTPGQP